MEEENEDLKLKIERRLNEKIKDKNEIKELRKENYDLKQILLEIPKDIIMKMINERKQEEVKNNDFQLEM